MKRILVIDDRSDVPEVSCAVLRNAGYEVELAASGKEGFWKLREFGCALAIVAVVMREVDGLEIMSSFRTEFPSVRVLAIYGGDSLMSFDWIDVTLALCADGVLKRPFTPDELLAWVHKLVGAPG